MGERGDFGPGDDPTGQAPLSARASWLAVNGLPITPVEVAASSRARARGLLGRPGVDGAILLAPASSVHTVGMAFSIDVALCRRIDRAGAFVVEAVRTLPPGRITRPRIRARVVIEAEAGAFVRWGLVPGSRVELVESGPQSLSAGG